MSAFTIGHLARILQEGAGGAEPIDRNSDVLETPFEDLGYDSIAILETASRVQQQFGVRIDNELADLRTPGQFIDHVNELVAIKRVPVTTRGGH
ncbi:MAG: acyl carrier protein [Pseudonocardiaceae bacterium]